mgnify:FL=1
MVDTVKESGVWPVNELGEIVAKRGTGTNNILGYLPTHLVPTSTDNTLAIKHDTDNLGGWAYLQDSRYVSSTPKTITSGTKTKIDFSLVAIAYEASSGLSHNYNDTSDLFFPLLDGEMYTYNFRCKVKPTLQNGHLDFTIESPTVTFNPLTGQTVTFSKGAGDEHFFSFNLPVFISADVLTNGIALYVTPRDTGITIYDYSILIQRTYIPIQ